MRIISGKFRGKRLQAPKNLPARPTTDFAKEALFNILGNRLDFHDLRVLDLFSGTGNLSFELVSRGAPFVLAIDNNFGCTRFIANTAKKLEADEIKVYKSDVFKYLKNSRDQFDLIIADPPYDLDNKTEIIDLIFEKELLSEDGIFVLEHPDQDSFSNHTNFVEHRSYSTVNFSLFEIK